MSFFSPVNQARWARFRHNRRGYWSLWLFLILFLCSLGAELLANDRPLLVQYRGQLYVPVLKTTPSKPSAARSPPPPTIRILAAAPAGDSRLGAMAASTLRRDDN